MLGPRIGLNPDFFYGEPDDHTAGAWMKYLAREVSGASGSVFQSGVQGIDDLENGDYGKAAEGLLPGSLRDIFKAVGLYNEGVVSGGKQVKPGSFASGALQAAGFTPQADERTREGTTAYKNIQRAESHSKNHIVDNYGSGTTQADVQKWNAAHPDDRITPAQLKPKNTTGTIMGVKANPKNRAQLEDFAHAYQ